MNEEDYTPVILGLLDRDRKEREKRYGPEVGWLGAILKWDYWDSKGWEVENFWVEERYIGWRPKDHPEEGSIVLIQ